MMGNHHKTRYPANHLCKLSNPHLDAQHSICLSPRGRLRARRLSLSTILSAAARQWWEMMADSLIRVLRTAGYIWVQPVR